MSRIKINELATMDLEWFAIDRQGNVAAFWSAGDAFVPKFVFEDKERSEKLAELFELLPIGSRGKYAGNFTRYKTTTTAYLRCTCCNDRFDVFQDDLSDEQKAIKVNYEKECGKELGCFRSIYGMTDKYGKAHWYKKKLLLLKKEIFLPEPPAFIQLNLFMAKCCNCGKNIIAFDNRIHGPNALEKDDNSELKNYVPTLRKVTENVRVSVAYEIDYESSPEDFSEITIATISEAKYKKLFEMEM